MPDGQYSSESPAAVAVQIRRKGWPIQNATFRRKIDAEIWARKIETEMDQGRFVDQGQGRETTLFELIETYIEQVTVNRPSENSRIAEELRLRRFQREEKALCAHVVTNLTPENFEAYRDRRKRARKKNGTPIANSTINKELMLIKRVIDFKRRRLGITVNPANSEDVRRLPVNDERDVRLSAEEIARLLRACDELRNPLIRAIVEFGFETGARRGSILRLEWHDVDLQGCTALLRAVKNSRSPDKIINHRIGLTRRATAILAGLPRTDAKVFPLTPNAFRLGFNRARQKAGLEHFRFHDTRHERVSSLFEAGWSMPEVMAQSGHKDPKSVKRYANINASHLASKLAAMEE